MRGEFRCTMDAKGRMNFPVKLREEFGATFIISKTIGAECLKVYSMEDWDALVKKIKEMPQTKTAQIQRFLFGSAFDIEPDKQGRALIPAPLREYAGLDTDVVIVGLEGRAEIWDKEKWEALNSGKIYAAGLDVVSADDYEHGTTLNVQTGERTPLAGPKGKLVILHLSAEGNYVAVRPSGTEPKVKFYLFASLPPGVEGDVFDRLDSLEAALKN